jgi:pimeloyl-ACP methyl ester carboxylesterase
MNTNAQMLLFSFLSYYDFFQPDTEQLEKNVKDMLLSVKEDLQFSGISWGPAAYKDTAVLSEALIYAVKNKRNDGKDEYTIVFRGTNPLSIQSWLFQDLNVAGQTPWKRQSAHTECSNAYISKASDTSLAVHTEVRYENTTLLEWICNLLKNAGGNKIKINICGHSLGGLLSSTFALWLTDELTAMNMFDMLELSVYSFAGPGAGNSEYADYLNKKIGAGYISVNNNLDIAPLVWKESDMYDVLPGIYGDIRMNDIENYFYTALCRNVFRMDYQTLTTGTTIQSEIFMDLPSDYLIQAGFQHVVPYLLYAFVNEPLLCTDVLIKTIIQIIKDFVKDAAVGWRKVRPLTREDEQVLINYTGEKLNAKITNRT